MKASLYEGLAAGLAMLGVIGLAGVFYPAINPVQFGLDPGPQVEPLVRYSVGTPIAVLVLMLAWQFNRIAVRMKNEKRDVPQNKLPST